MDRLYLPWQQHSTYAKIIHFGWFGCVVGTPDGSSAGEVDVGRQKRVAWIEWIKRTVFSMRAKDSKCNYA